MTALSNTSDGDTTKLSRMDKIAIISLAIDLQKCDSVSKSKTKEINELRSALKSDSLFINNLSDENALCEKKAAARSGDLEVTKQELKEEKKATKKQKVLKWLSQGAGAFCTLFMGYLYVTK